MKDKKMFCENCGAEISTTAKFCMRCGCKIVLSDVKEPLSAKAEDADACEKKPVKEKTERKPFFAPGELRKFVRSGVAFLLSLVIVAFSFLPILSYKVEWERGETSDVYSCSYSALDYIVFLVDSFYEYDEEDIAESGLYDEFKNLQEELQDMDLEDEEHLNKDQKRLLRNYSLCYTRLLLRSEETTVSVSVAMAAAFSLLYIVFSLVLFAVATYNLIVCFLRKREAYARLVKMVSFVPFLTLLVHFAAKIAQISPLVQDAKCTMGSGHGMIIVSCAGILLAIVERVVFNYKRISGRRMVVNSISVALAAITVCMIFAPVLSASVTAAFRGKNTLREVTVTLDADSLLAVEMSKEDLYDKLDYIGSSKSEKREYLEGLSERFSDFSVSEMREGAADESMSSFLGATFLALLGEYATFIIITPYVILIAALFMSVAAQKCLAYLCLGETKSSKGALVGWYLFMLAGFILLTIYSCCINARLDSLSLYNLNGGVKAGIAIDFILCAALGICTSISRSFDKENGNKKRY